MEPVVPLQLFLSLLRPAIAIGDRLHGPTILLFTFLAQGQYLKSKRGRVRIVWKERCGMNAICFCDWWKKMHERLELVR